MIINKSPIAPVRSLNPDHPEAPFPAQPSPVSAVLPARTRKRPVDAHPHPAVPQLMAVLTPLTDFWLLGGASIAIWMLLLAAGCFRDRVEAVQTRFLQIPLAFSVLALVCNHPHFLVSYKIAYGRGLRFILQNWFALVAVPALLLAGYVLAFCNFDRDITAWPVIASVNTVLALLGIQFQLGASSNLGGEILGLSVWLMYFTVGWHYAKQVFGAMLVQARFADYPVSKSQRTLFKFSVFSVAIYQFVFVVGAMNEATHDHHLQDPRFTGVSLSAFELPSWLLTLSTIAVAFSLSSIVAIVFIGNWRKHRKLPPLNLVTPWIAFHIWWIPLTRLPEFYLAMIPFFHSLQYLPFAYKLETNRASKSRRPDLRLSLNLIAILLAGFLSFELIPSLLDGYFETPLHQTAWFFMTAFAVFINIHHFFIDSVIWRFQQPETCRLFFGSAPETRT